MDAQKDVLGVELAYFDERKVELLASSEGQFALIHGRDLAGTFTTFGEAYTAGIQRFGNVPMLIKQITREEPRDHLPAFQHGLIHARA
jgi:hypothetical protein